MEKNATRIQAAQQRGTLPYFLRDNAKIVERIKHIEANRKEYERLKADPNYIDVEFNPENGGLKATHTKHIKHYHKRDPRYFEESLTSTDLEIKCQEELFRSGNSCILLAEGIKSSDGSILTALDANINGYTMDIRSITVKKDHYGAAINAKLKQLHKYNEIYPDKATSICLYFHDSTMYSRERIIAGLKWIIEQFGADKVIGLNQIIIVQRGNGMDVIKLSDT